MGAPILGIAIPTKMTTGNTDNQHSVADQDEIKGGWHSGASTAVRDAIPVPRLQEGMVFRVPGGTSYEYVSGAWVALPGGTPYTDEQARDAIAAALTDSTTIDFSANDGADTITAVVIDDSISNTKLANMAANTIKGNNTASTADPIDLTATQAATLLSPYLTQPLAQVNETSAAAVTIACIVATTNNGVIGFGSASGYSKFDWNAFAWTSGTISVVPSAAITWAIYCSTTDRVWCGDGVSKVFVVNPSTMAGTDISAATGSLQRATYSSGQNKVYGWVVSATALKEMDPTTGVVARTYTPPAGLSFYQLGIDPTSGYLLAQHTSTAGLIGINPSTFNSNAFTISSAPFGGSLTNANEAITVIGNIVIAPCLALTAFHVFDTSALTNLRMTNRGSGGSIATKSPTTGRAYLLYLASRAYCGRTVAATALDKTLNLDALVPLVSGSSGGVTVKDACGAPDGYVYALTSGNSLIRVSA